MGAAMRTLAGRRDARRIIAHIEKLLSRRCDVRMVDLQAVRLSVARSANLLSTHRAYNSEVWPLQIGALIVGMWFWADARSPAVGCSSGGGNVAVCWLWVAWAFHWQRCGDDQLVGELLRGLFCS